MAIVRDEKPDDIAAIRRVVEAAFGRASEADLVDALRRNNKFSISLAAEQDDQIIGHILFTPVSLEPGAFEYSAVGLAPLAVSPKFQRQGVGSQLVIEGLRRCHEAGHDFAVVLGHPEYYPKFGFTRASGFGIKCEYNVRDEAFMLIELKKSFMKGRSGLVKYQPEFNQF